MVGLKALFLFGFSVMLWVSLAGVVTAGVPDKSKCDEVKDSDRRNICLSQINDRGEGNSRDKNRYQNKDHSSYYCTLVKKRDYKNMCHAILEQNKAKCDLIGDRAIEKECLDAIK